MSERTMEKARQVVHRLSEWYFAEGGDNDPDSPIDREDMDALHDLVRTAEATAETERRQAGAYAAVAAIVRRELEAQGAGENPIAASRGCVLALGIAAVLWAMALAWGWWVIQRLLWIL